LTITFRFIGYFLKIRKSYAKVVINCISTGQSIEQPLRKSDMIHGNIFAIVRFESVETSK